ncbi:ABC transporter ATP-binding protein [Intrasporangium mesophilum]
MKRKAPSDSAVPEAGPSVVEVKGLCKTFRREGGEVVPAVDGVDLEIGPGEMVVLLGPSGCGKTTLLRSLVGLETPESGTISANGRLVYSSAERVDLPPEKRGISMMFQHYALWPHMTVGSNVEYPLVNRKVPKAQRREAVRRALASVGLEEMQGQYPGQLSGGQQQRIALARSMVTDPQAVVFDEPLSNVDAQVRQGLRVEILAAQRRVGFAGIYVTHDQNEAMQMATRLAVMRRGKIVQIGTPMEVYNRPVNRFVATFVGTSNILDVRDVSRDPSGHVRVRTDVGDLTLDRAPEDVVQGGYQYLAARPETLSLARPGEPGLAEVVVETVMFSGSTVEFTVLVGEDRRLSGLSTPAEAWMRPGDTAMLVVNPTTLTLLKD